MKFRTKPFEIEAERFTGENTDKIFEWTGGKFEIMPANERYDDPEVIAAVYDNLHGTWVGVKAGQWIIRGMKGEYYPCDHEVFMTKYEAIR